MKTKLDLVTFDGCHIDAERGQVTIKNIVLTFDPDSVDLQIDLLDALDLAVKVVRDGTVKPTYIN